MAAPLFQRTIVDGAGNVIPGASVEVRIEATDELAAIYTDRALTTVKANPTTTDANGFVEFFVAKGEYRVRAVSGEQEIVWRYVQMIDLVGQLVADQTGNEGKFLTTDGETSAWQDITGLPNQTGEAGKFLTTDGTDASWAEVDALPDQTDNAGKYLTTDGTEASWATLDTDANSTTKGLYEHSNTIAANYTIGSGNNAMSAGPITINSGVSVTVPSGSRWVVN